MLATLISQFRFAEKRPYFHQCKVQNQSYAITFLLGTSSLQVIVATLFLLVGLPACTLTQHLDILIST